MCIRDSVVLADHGLTRPWQVMEPDTVGDGGTPALRLPCRPRLKESEMGIRDSRGANPRDGNLT